MILVDTALTTKLTFRFIPRQYPTLKTGSALIVLTNEQTEEVFTYDRAPLMRVKHWLEGTIKRTDIVKGNNYTVCVYLYEDSNPEIFRGKIMAFDFTEKGYTEGINQKLENTTGDFKERASSNTYKMRNE